MNSTDIVSIVLLCIGVLFNLLGCIGLIRLPDVYNRLQAATKCVTLGTCSTLLSLVFFFGISEIGVKALVAIPLLFFGSTVAAHALVRGAYHFGVELGKGTVRDDYRQTIKKEDKKDHEVPETTRT
jgi:multicomponent Na+:H+ antiporter subunit G